MIAAMLAAVALATWQQGPPLPQARTEVAGAAFRGGVAVVGGYAADGSTVARADLYVPNRGWSRLPDLPAPRNHAAAAGARGKLYVLGGNGPEGATRTAWVLEGSRWRALRPLPDARAAAGAGVIGRTLYVAGGVGPGGLRRTLLALDLRSGRWRTLRGPTPREHLAVAALRGRLYVAGGRTAGFDTNLALVESWTPPRGPWRTLPALPESRGGTGLAAAAGSLVSVGGEAPGGTIGSVFRWRPGAVAWTRLPDLPTPRHGLAVVGLGSTVYVIGGGPQPGLHVSDANESLALGR